MNFIKKIFSPFCLTVSLLLLLFIFYKSEFSWDGTRRYYYFNFYIVSFLLLIFSIFTFFINQKVKEYFIILSFSLVVSLYFFEGYLTFKDSHYQNIKKRKTIYEKISGKKYDTRTRLEVYEELKKLEKKVSIKVSPKHHLPNNRKLFPLSSISNSKTIYGNENGYYFIYQSDRYGFNNPDEEWDSKEIEYLLVGDSFVHGANVNRPNDISSVLRTLTNKSVLNLGYSGNGPLIEYASLREYLKPNVKKVLWFYYEDNDFIDLNEEIKNNILNNYLNDLTFSQNLKSKQEEIDSLINNIIKKSISGDNLKFIKLYKTRNKLLKKEKIKNKQFSPQPHFKQILKLTKDLIGKNNSELYFIYLPGYNRYKNDYDNTNYNLVKKIINELDIPFIDIHSEVFKKEKNPLKLFPFEMFGHYNVEGYKKISKTIYKLSSN